MQTQVNYNYDEFVKERNILSKISQDIIKRQRVLKTDIEKLDDMINRSTNDAKVLANEVKKVDEKTVANKVWILFHTDLLNVQRAISGLIQETNIRTRLLESMAVLRSGYIPIDFIGVEKLKQILKEIKDLNPNRKLAFSEQELNLYYNYPMASLSMVNDAKYIELIVPLVNKDNENYSFRIKKLKTYPFKCVDAAVCSKNLTYEMHLNDEMLLFPSNSTNSSIPFSTKFSNMECIHQFDNKICWMVESDVELTTDPCIKSVYNKTISLDFCDIRNSSRQVKNWTMGIDEVYTTFYNESGILISNLVKPNVNLTTYRNFSLYDFVASDDLSKNNLKEIFNRASIKREFKIMSKEMEANLKLLGNRDLFYLIRNAKDSEEEAKAIVEGKRGKLRRYSKFVISTSERLLPFLIGIALLAANRRWYSIGLVNIVVTPRGTHAAWLPPAFTSWLPPTITDLKEAVDDILTSFVALIIGAIALGLLAYIAYMTVCRLTYIEHYYGRVYARNIVRSKIMWNLVTHTVIKRHYLFYKKIEIVVIVFELSYKEKEQLYIPDIESFWIMNDNDQSSIRLFQNIQLSGFGDNDFIDDLTVKVQDRQVTWNGNEGINVLNLANKRTKLSLVKLNDYKVER